jgi:hypothetical protein
MKGMKKEYFENFELWCEECVKVSDKLTGQVVPFKLNAPQRRVAAIFESQRRMGKPIRVLLLKARQWGGSTLVQAYMAWMQLVRHTCWNSLVCAHYKEASAVIRGAYSLLLKHYPAEMKEDGDAKDWTLQPYEKTQGISYLPARDCRIAIATAMRPEALRGNSFHMAHLSEAAFWADGREDIASAIVRTVGGSVPLEPDTLVVVESTANGTNNYMYHEWERAVRGESDKIPVFVPWYEIEIYRIPLSEGARDHILATLSDYERSLFNKGVSAESIAWYRKKSREYATPQEMMAEFPSTPEEAFSASFTPTFSEEDIANVAEVKDLEGYKSVLVNEFDESEVCLDGVRSRIVVVVPSPGEEPHSIALYGVKDGRIILLREEQEPDLDCLMRKCAEWGDLYHANVVVGNVEDDGLVSHGRWCLRYSRSHYLPMEYDDNDSAMVDLTPRMMTDLVDLHRQLMRDGALADSGDMKEEYKVFEKVKGWRQPRVLLRLVASHFLERVLRVKEISPIDFL